MSRRYENGAPFLRALPLATLAAIRYEIERRGVKVKKESKAHTAAASQALSYIFFMEILQYLYREYRARDYTFIIRGMRVNFSPRFQLRSRQSRGSDFDLYIVL